MNSAQFKVVLDTNLVVSAEINRRGNPAAVIRAWFAERFRVATSDRM